MDGSKTEETPAAEIVVEDESTSAEPQKSFWKVYTPMNVVREIKYRITGS
jgi:hypothetical protein